MLQLASHLYFTPAAATMRTELFQQLSQGVLPGAATLSGQLQQGQQVQAGSAASHSLLRRVLEALAAGPAAPKLMALLLTAMGLRERPPLRRPGGLHSKTHFS